MHYRGRLLVHAAKTADPWERVWAEAHERPGSDAALIVQRLGHGRRWSGWDYGEVDGVFGVVADEWETGTSPLILPLGAIVAVTSVVGCEPTEMASVDACERAFGDYRPGRSAIALASDPVRLNAPVPASGNQATPWRVGADVADQVIAELLRGL